MFHVLKIRENDKYQGRWEWISFLGLTFSKKTADGNIYHLFNQTDSFSNSNNWFERMNPAPIHFNLIQKNLNIAMGVSHIIIELRTEIVLQWDPQ